MPDPILKINPLLYITDWSPVPEEVLQASQWFETEYMTLKIGGSSTTGTSGASFPYDSGQSMLAWFLAQGWTVYQTDNGYDQGHWVPLIGDYFKYWYRLHHLQRRKLQSERVLQDMIEQFTEAYNEGRLLNNRRYEEIVALYDVMLDRTEDELNSNVEVAEYDSLVDSVIAALPGDFSEYKGAVEGLLDDYGTSRIAEVNLRFDNELASAKQSLIARGMHNATVLSSTTGGIERNREIALNDLHDRLTERKLSGQDRIQSVRDNMRSRVLDAALRIREMKRSGRFDKTEFRNRIMTAMLDFMERRRDEYPGIGELANLAASLGYSEGGTVAPPVG